MEVLLPSPYLSPFIKRYVFVSSHGESMVNRLIPGTEFTLAIRLRGSTKFVHADQTVQLDSAIISGLRTSPRFVKYEAASSCVIIVFHSQAVRNFFNVPAHHLLDQSIPLTEFAASNAISALHEKLNMALNKQQVRSAVESFLLTQLNPLDPDRIVDEAVRRIHSSSGIIKIKQLSHDLCISTDAFEKRFRYSIGTSPKQFAQTVRLRSLINAGQNKTLYSLTDLALDGGYFDSAHFSKAFKNFTGLSPTEFFKFPLAW